VWIIVELLECLWQVTPESLTNVGPINDRHMRRDAHHSDQCISGRRTAQGITIDLLIHTS
jgi:hypothetical protein